MNELVLSGGMNWNRQRF